METNVIKRKICLLGDNMVGKTSLIRRFVHNEFSDEYITTVGTQISRKNIDIKYPDVEDNAIEYNFTMSIWDIIGQREYRSLALRHFVEASGALVVCDITRKETLENIHEWLNPLYYMTGEIPTYLLINKNDLQDEIVITQEEIDNFSDKYDVPYLYTSAKTDENVEEAFVKLAEKILDYTAKQTKPKTIIQVTDIITTDFCETLGGFEIGMPKFHEAFKKIRGNFLNPTKDMLHKLTPDLIEILQIEKGPEIAKEKEMKYNELLRNIK